MAKEPQNSQTEENQRKIYVLPKELVERISEFQKKNGFSSEVEAVRSLLDKALLSYQTPDDLLHKINNASRSRLELENTIKNYLFGHPLVENISLNKGRYDFTLINDRQYHIDENNKLYERDPRTGELDSWVPF